MMLAAIASGFTFPLAAETYTAASYVQDGLVGQWDGLENAGLGLPHDPTTNYWVDLTGQSGDFAVFTSVASFTANGLKKNAQGIMATNVTANARSDVRTIEVVVSGAPASGWVHAFLITKDQTVSFANGRTAGGIATTSSTITILVGGRHRSRRRKRWPSSTRVVPRRKNSARMACRRQAANKRTTGDRQEIRRQCISAGVPAMKPAATTRRRATRSMRFACTTVLFRMLKSSRTPR